MNADAFGRRRSGVGSPGERVAGEARRVDSDLCCAKQPGGRRAEVLSGVAMLAFEKQQAVWRVNVRRAAGRRVNRLDGGQKDGAPAALLRPDQPVGLLVVDEEMLVEEADILDRGAAKEDACAPGRIDPASVAVVPVQHSIQAWSSPVREALDRKSV